MTKLTPLRPLRYFQWPESIVNARLLTPSTPLGHLDWLWSHQSHRLIHVSIEELPHNSLDCELYGSHPECPADNFLLMSNKRIEHSQQELEAIAWLWYEDYLASRSAMRFWLQFKFNKS